MSVPKMVKNGVYSFLSLGAVLRHTSVLRARFGGNPVLSIIPRHVQDASIKQARTGREQAKEE